MEPAPYDMITDLVKQGYGAGLSFSEIMAQTPFLIGLAASAKVDANIRLDKDVRHHIWNIAAMICSGYVPSYDEYMGNEMPDLSESSFEADFSAKFTAHNQSLGK